MTPTPPEVAGAGRARNNAFKQIIKATGTYSIGILGSRIIGFLFLFVYTRYLTPADYGVMELLDLLSGVAGLVLGVRLGQGLFYYYFAVKEEAARKLFIATAMLGSFVLGILVMLLGVTASGLFSRLLFGNASRSSQVILVFVAFSCVAINEVGLCCLRVQDRAGAYNWVSLGRVFVNNAISLTAVVGLGLGLNGVLISNAVAALLTALVLAIWILRSAGLQFSGSALRQLAVYSIPMGLTAFGEFAIHFSNRLFLNPVISLAEMGIFGISYKLGMLVTFIFSPFIVYWTSQMKRIVDQPGGEHIYSRTSTYVTTGLLFTAVAISSWSVPIVHTFLDPRYHSCLLYVPWLSAAYALRHIGENYRGILLIEKRTDLAGRGTSIGAIICVAGYALLVPRYQIAGAIFSTFLGFLVISIIGFWDAHRLRPFPFEHRRAAKAVAAYVASMGLYWVLPRGPLVDWAGAVLVCLAFVTVLIAVRFAEHDEIQLLRANWTALWRRMRPLPRIAG